MLRRFSRLILRIALRTPLVVVRSGGVEQANDVRAYRGAVLVARFGHYAAQEPRQEQHSVTCRRVLQNSIDRLTTGLVRGSFRLPHLVVALGDYVVVLHWVPPLRA